MRSPGKRKGLLGSLGGLTLLVAGANGFAQDDPWFGGRPQGRAAQGDPEPIAGARMRGGFSVAGGAAAGTSTGAMASFGLRVGVQFDSRWSVYYANTAMLVWDNGLLDVNALVPNVTLADLVDLGLGPSLAAIGFPRFCGGPPIDALPCRAPPSNPGYGAHARVAVNLGERSGGGGQRRGVSIGIDVDVLTAGSETLLLAALGVGGEWF